MKQKSSLAQRFGVALTLVFVGNLLVAFGALSGNGRAVLPAQTKWRVSEPIVYENLSVFPLLERGNTDISSFVTLDEALTSGDVVVTESGGDMLFRNRGGNPSQIRPITSGALVNQLVLVNRGKKPLILLAGEVVSGGKQDRIIAKDRIVLPGADPLPLDVFCVEHGRWAGATAQFSAAKMMVHPSVREKAVVDKDQSEVWAAVRGGSSRSATAGGVVGGAIGGVVGSVVSAEAPSESYVKIYQSTRISGQVESFAEEFARRFARAIAGLKDERVIGVVVACGGEVAWADAFASSALFDRYWSKLLRSYSVEALSRSDTHERPSIEQAREFMQPLNGHETVESEPRAYRWRQVAQGRYAEISLDSLVSDVVTLHWCKVLRTSN